MHVVPALNVSLCALHRLPELPRAHALHLPHLRHPRLGLRAGSTLRTLSPTTTVLLGLRDLSRYRPGWLLDLVSSHSQGLRSCLPADLPPIAAALRPLTS